ncbi:MAG: aminoglycoside/choline kinase family phosphotransferase [Sulfurimonas sp.]|jgi:aminoglycoside/choline kinase family phosphotransferase
MDKIKAWLDTTPYKKFNIEVASADASFRKYYRLSSLESTFILMDSSLEKESLAPFIDVTSRLRAVNVNAPKILEQNLDDGFLIIQDFGNTNYLNVLDDKNFKTLYSKAIDTIITMQEADIKGLPVYDKKFLHLEMDFMKDWYLEKLLKRTLNEVQKKILKNSLEAISEVVLSQAQNLFVHRDYHSRNIMLTAENEIGVIDYQDAMNGAITYDLVSLLKDCYIAYERKEVEKLVLEFRDKKGIAASDELFLKWFDFMGMQRHIKVLGIFSRLYLRDGKDGYLKDIPLTLKYTLDTASRYEETKELEKLLKELQ